MSTYIAKKRKKSCFSVSSVLVRSLIYSGFFTGILAYFYDFQLNTIVMPTSSERWPEVKQDITSINEAQKAYYAKNNKFSDSLEGLGVKLRSTNNYKYKILSSLMKPVQTLENKREPAQFESAIAIAIPESSGGESYRGVVFALKKESSSNQLITISGICKSEGERVTVILPTLDGKKFHCPPGTTLLR